jgi:membrane associated rhomboid family serine protease
MGIYDRDYVRADGGGGGRGVRPTSWSSAGGPMGRLRFVSVNTWIIAINIVVFVLAGLSVRAGVPVFMDKQITVPQEQIGDTPRAAIPQDERIPPVNQSMQRPLIDPTDNQLVGVARYRVMDPFNAWGHFSTAKGFLALEVWRLVTFQFLHAGVIHIAFNMLGLYFFGPLVEQYLGGKRYAAFYLMCGICGGLAYLILNIIGMVGISLPGALRVENTTPLVGASAGVFGVIMACAFIAPTMKVQLIFPPIPMQMRTMAYIFVGLAAANLIIFQGANQGGDAAHLGGAVAGYFFIRRPHLLHDFFEVLGPKKPRSSGGRTEARGSVLRGGAEPAKRDAEVDRVLDKVRDEGLHSLTDAEKKVLREATEDRRG